MPSRNLRMHIYKDLLSLVDEETKKVLLEEWPGDIKYMTNPSPALQLLAVQLDAVNIMDIQSPCEEAQRFAIKDLDMTTRIGISYLLNQIKNVSPVVLLELYETSDEESKSVIKKHPNFKSQAEMILTGIRSQDAA